MTKSIILAPDVPVAQLPPDWAIAMKQAQSGLIVPIADPTLKRYLGIQDGKWSILNLIHSSLPKKLTQEDSSQYHAYRDLNYFHKTHEYVYGQLLEKAEHLDVTLAAV